MMRTTIVLATMLAIASTSRAEDSELVGKDLVIQYGPANAPRVLPREVVIARAELITPRDADPRLGRFAVLQIELTLGREEFPTALEAANRVRAAAGQPRWSTPEKVDAELRLRVPGGKPDEPLVSTTQSAVLVPGMRAEFNFWLTADQAAALAPLVIAGKLNPELTATVLVGVNRMAVTPATTGWKVGIVAVDSAVRLRVVPPRALGPGEILRLTVETGFGKRVELIGPGAKVETIVAGRKPVRYVVEYASAGRQIHSVTGVFNEWSADGGELVLPVSVITVSLRPQLAARATANQGTGLVVLLNSEDGTVLPLLFSPATAAQPANMLLAEGRPIIGGIAVRLGATQQLAEAYRVDAADFSLPTLQITDAGLLKPEQLVEHYRAVAAARLRVLLNPNRKVIPLELQTVFTHRITEDVLPVNPKPGELLVWAERMSRLSTTTVDATWPLLSAGYRLAVVETPDDAAIAVNLVRAGLAGGSSVRERRAVAAAMLDFAMQRCGEPEYLAPVEDAVELLAKNPEQLPAGSLARLWPKLPRLRVPEFMPLTAALTVARHAQHVVLAPGTHRLRRTITIAATVRIEARDETTAIELDHGTSLNIAAKNVAFRGVKFHRGADTSAAAVEFNPGSSGSFAGCHIRNERGPGLVINNGSVSLVSSTIEGCSGAGIVARAGAKVVLNRCTIRGCHGDGLIAEGPTTRAELTVCRIEENRQCGVHARDGAWAGVQWSFVAGQSGPGLRAEAGRTGISVVSSWLVGNQSAGSIAGDAWLTAREVLAFANRGSGFELSGTGWCRLENAFITDNLYDGVRATGHVSVELSGSTISGNDRGFSGRTTGKVKIQHCVFRMNRDAGLRMNGDAATREPATIVSNLFTKNDGCGAEFIGGSARVHGNRAEGNTRHGMRVELPSGLFEISNNTLCGNSGNGLTLRLSRADCRCAVLRNWFMGNGGNGFWLDAPASESFTFTSNTAACNREAGLRVPGVLATRVKSNICFGNSVGLVVLRGNQADATSMILAANFSFGNDSAIQAADPDSDR